MQITIKYEDGVRADAILLATGTNRMRVLVMGSNDTEEWTQLDGIWRTEDGRQIEFEAMFVDGNEWSEFSADPCPKTAAVGGSHS